MSMRPVQLPHTAPNNILLRIDCLVDPFYTPFIVLLNSIGYSEIIIVEEITWIAYLEPALLTEQQLYGQAERHLIPYLFDVMDEHETDIGQTLDITPYIDAVNVLALAIYNELKSIIKQALCPLLGFDGCAIEELVADTITRPGWPAYRPDEIKLSVLFTEEYNEERKRHIRMRSDQ